jgi:dipeptidyl aminopeptidase/acylaminoacyl peptidase
MLHIADAMGRSIGNAGPVIAFSWSPTGRHFAYGQRTSGPSGAPAVYRIVEVNGRELAQLPGSEGPLAWSPDGSALAYQSTANGLVLYEPGSGRQRDLGLVNGRILAWVHGGRALLVATNYREGEGFGASYEAHLLDLGTAEMRRLPQLDNDMQFWVSPAGGVVVYLAPAPARLGLGVLDLTTLSTRMVANSTIAFPGERVPAPHVAFEPNGTHIVWASVERELTLYRAPLDGGPATTVTTLPGLFVQFSPDMTRLSYIVPGDPPKLWAAKADGSDRREIGAFFNAVAWRPRPPR